MMNSQNTQVSKEDARKELARRELARRHLKYFTLYNFEGFKLNWHHEVLFKKLEQVQEGKIKRLMIFMPPRHSKSESASVQFPAWYIGKDKDKNIITASYASSLATDFGRQVRNLIKTKEYQNIFDTRLAEDSEAKDKWHTNGRGAYNAVGVGGAVTGKGADLLLIDDPTKNRQDAESKVIRDGVWDWYKSTARTRLSPDGAIVIIMTRWHKDDLAGRILANSEKGEWDIVEFPAIAIHDEEHRKQGEALWAGHFTLDHLEAIKKDIGIYEWSALYQQNPVASESQEFKEEWVIRIPRSVVEEKQTRKFATIDSALTTKESSDNTGVVLNYVDDKNTWHIDARRYRLDAKGIIDLVFKLHADGFEAIGIEEGPFTNAIKPFYEEECRKRNTFPNIVMLKHKGVAKELRIRALVPRYMVGAIKHIDGATVELEEEMFTFPRGVYDDVLDALAYQTDIAKPFGGTKKDYSSLLKDLERDMRYSDIGI